MMKKSELKNTLKPLIKECVRELIFEEGVLSGIITEVAQGLSPQQSTSQPRQPQQQRKPKENNEALQDAKKQLSEVKSSLQNSIGLKGVFKGTEPLRSTPAPGPSSAYNPLKDMDPSDPGVNIDMWFKK